jgi:exopolysaccharide biosynthesis polyprenyl glycosylphosphotransferase
MGSWEASPAQGSIGDRMNTVTSPGGSGAGTGRHFSLNAAERGALLALSDVVSGAAACAVAYLLWELLSGKAIEVPKLGPALFGIVWLIALLMVAGYDAQTTVSGIRALAVIVKALPIASCFGFLFFFAQPYRMARPVVVLTVGLGALALITTRLAVARLLSHEMFVKRAMLAGLGDMSPGVAEALEAARLEYRVVASGPVPDRIFPGDRSVEVLDDALKRYGIHEVIVANDDSDQAAVAIEACMRRGVGVIPLSDLTERYLGRVPLETVDSGWFLSLPGHSLYARPYLAVRAVADVLLSGLISLPFLVLLPLIAALIKLDSDGPVFFRQRRVGRYGRTFEILKLRTMVDDAERAGHRWAEPADSRVTRMGRLLRATRLDEVPQVLNVLRGDMSFIGPRPERPEFVRDLERELPHYRLRLAVTPGISGWAQVKNGYASSVSESRRKLEYDLYYVKHQSLRLDLQIVFHTVFTVLGLRGR